MSATTVTVNGSELDDEVTIVTPPRRSKRQHETVAFLHEDGCGSKKQRSKKVQESVGSIANKCSNGGDGKNVDMAEEVEKRSFKVGDKVCKWFEDGGWFSGTVDSGPHNLDNQLVWRVVYEDGDSEELYRSEIEEILFIDTGAEKTPETSGTTIQQEKLDEPNYGTAVANLCFRVGIAKEEIVDVLSTMKPPYKLNEAIRKIHQKRDMAEYKEEDSAVRFMPTVGMRVVRNESGAAYHGEIVGEGENMRDDNGKMLKHWPVRWDQGGEDDMTFIELQECFACRPRRSHPARGRELYALELFSGCSIVSQEFARMRFRVRSIDIDLSSNASDKVDIMKLTFDNIGNVPDVIWASPPCRTYSNLAGGTHNNPKAGEYEKTEVGRLHAQWLAQLIAFLRWTKEHNENFIVVIENPVGLLSKMPLMQEMVQKFKLKMCTVHYCAFGRDDKKPTHLWTNVSKLIVVFPSVHAISHRSFLFVLFSKEQTVALPSL